MNKKQYTSFMHLRSYEYAEILPSLLKVGNPHVTKVVDEPTGEECYKVSEEPDGKGRYLVLNEEGNRFEYRIRSGKVFREQARVIDMTATGWAIDWLGDRYDELEEEERKRANLPQGESLRVGYSLDEINWPETKLDRKHSEPKSDSACDLNAKSDPSSNPITSLLDWLEAESLYHPVRFFLVGFGLLSLLYSLTQCFTSSGS